MTDRAPTPEQIEQPPVADALPLTLDDLNPVYTYPLGLCMGTVTLPDGAVISRTRVDRLVLDDALREAIAHHQTTTPA